MHNIISLALRYFNVIIMCVCVCVEYYCIVIQEELSERVKERERELRQLKEAQVTQIEQRCREVDSLKQQLEGQLFAMEGELDTKSKEMAAMEDELARKMAAKESELSNVKEERTQLQEQLNKSQMLSQQLTAEGHAYQQRMELMSK